MKIAFIGTRGIPARYGGFETCVEELSTRLADRGYEVTVFCRSDNPKHQSTHYRRVKLVHVQKMDAGRLASLYNSLIATMHAGVADHDVLHYFGGGNVPFCLLARLLGKNVVLTVDGIEWNRLSFSWPARFYLRALAELGAIFPSALVTDSPSCQEWYISRTMTTPTYIPYGTSESRLVNEETLSKHNIEKGKYILFVGRLVHEKGAHTLIEAFKSLDTEIKLAIVGGFPGQSEYVDNIKSASDSRIRFLGYIYGDEFLSIRNGALAYVHPSFLDGTSISLLGALGAGLCIIASDIRENKDVAGDSALYFRTGDSGNLASLLKNVIEDGALVQRMREASAQRARSLYTWDRITDSYEELYTKIGLTQL